MKANRSALGKRSDRERDIFLQMAETWLHAAVLAERREGDKRALAKCSNSSVDHLPILLPIEPKYLAAQRLCFQELLLAAVVIPVP